MSKTPKKPMKESQIEPESSITNEIVQPNNTIEDDYNSEEDERSVIVFDSELHFLKDVQGVDIVFLIDTTASMNPYKVELQHYIRRLCNDAKKSLSQYYIDDLDFTQYGLVTYRDHDQENKTYVSMVNCNLTSIYTDFRTELMKIECLGGGDEPEAVLDGLDTAVNQINWRPNSLKYIYHILDMPPHGPSFSNLPDSTPECPCNIKVENVLKDLRGKIIEYTVIKLNDQLQQMIEIFSNISKIDVMYAKLTPDMSKPSIQ